MRTTSILTLAALATLSMCLAGCIHGMTAPADFVHVERADLGPYVVRTISADGVVVGLRTQDNPKQGTLEFWSEAVRNDLTGRGYRAVKSEEMHSSSGVPGTLMEFTTHQSGTDFTYLLAVYVTSDTVLLAEAGGKADAVRKHGEAIRKSLASAQ